MGLKMLILGSGVMGKGFAVEADQRGHDVDIVGNDPYGVIDNAAFIGSPFLSAPNVGKDVVDSTSTFMSRARDEKFPSITLSKLEIVLELENGSLPSWTEEIDDLEELEGARVEYTSYTGSPRQYSDYQLEVLKGRYQERNFSEYEIKSIVGKERLKGYDRVIVAAGLAYKDFAPEFEALPIRGRLLHKTIARKDQMLSSKMDEGNMSYIVERNTRYPSMNGKFIDVVLGGEAAHHTSTDATIEENIEFANDRVNKAAEIFGNSIKDVFGEVVEFGEGFEDVRITQDLRPGTLGGDYGEQYYQNGTVVHATGGGGQVICSGPAREKRVLDMLEGAS